MTLADIPIVLWIAGAEGALVLAAVVYLVARAVRRRAGPGHPSAAVRAEYARQVAQVAAERGAPPPEDPHLGAPYGGRILSARDRLALEEAAKAAVAPAAALSVVHQSAKLPAAARCQTCGAPIVFSENV